MEQGKRIVLLGATGYTGSLIAEELHKLSIPFSIAGRSLEKLNLLKNRLSLIDSIEEFELNTHNDVIDKYDIIINSIGPFNLWGKTILDKCIENGKIYIDISGEQEFIKASFENQNKVRQSGATIIHSVSFESCLADLLIAESYDPKENYDNISTYYYFEKSRPSGGTKLTMQLAPHYSTYTLRDTKLISISPLTFKEDVSFSVLPGIDTAVFMPYPEVIFMKNKANVSNSSSFLLLNEMDARLLMRSKSQSELSIEDILSKHGRSNLKPPSPEERTNQKFVLIVKLITERGETITHSVEGSDMYGVTAEIVSRLVKHISGETIIAYGVITPAEAFGNEWEWNWISKINYSESLV